MIIENLPMVRCAVVWLQLSMMVAGKAILNLSTPSRQWNWKRWVKAHCPTLRVRLMRHVSTSFKLLSRSQQQSFVSWQDDARPPLYWQRGLRNSRSGFVVGLNTELIKDLIWSVWMFFNFMTVPVFFWCPLLMVPTVCFDRQAATGTEELNFWWLIASDKLA